MRAILLVLGYLISFGLYISFILLPYYIAYCMIEPHSFLGVVGVFILGTVIVPLSIWGITLLIGILGLSFEALAEKRTRIEIQTIKDINPPPPSKKSKLVYVLGFLLIISIGFIVCLLNNEQDRYDYDASLDRDATSEAVEAANDAIEAADLQSVEDVSHQDIQFSNDDEVTNNENLMNESENLDIPHLKTLGPSHLNLDIWFKDEQGQSFYMEFKNSKRPELDTNGFCQILQNNVEDTNRYSALIDKYLKVHAIFK